MTFSNEANNIRERLVKCYSCKTEMTTAEPNPKCSRCNFSMITVLSSMLPVFDPMKEEK